MSERLRRFSKISPSIGNAQFGYSVCPKSDDEFATPYPKTLAIPLSAIQTTGSKNGLYKFLNIFNTEALFLSIGCNLKNNRYSH